MMHTHKVLIALLASLALVSASPKNYACPDSCNQSPTCHCGSIRPPGGLAPSDVPQFVVLTNDDSVSSVTYPVIRGITDKHKNRNGCPMPATWFIQTQYTDPDLVRKLYVDTHEVATHTVHHPSLPSATEILGAREWLNKTAGIPLEKIRGFRAPFLVHDPAQRKILQENGFLYDSSITEQYGMNMASPNASSKIWPFTMDYGIPINCAVGTGKCDDSEKLAGLWEFPLWAVQGADNAVIASMDPQGDNFEQYSREFDRNYNGNRAPLGLYLHAGLLMGWPEHIGQIDKFLEYALSHENVWLVTIGEVLDWMKNPVPASQYQLECTPPTDVVFTGGHFCPPPITCENGEWNASACACACQNQESRNLNGFCPDDQGICTVSKSYNDKHAVFLCPGQSIDPKDDVAAAPAPSPVEAPVVHNATNIAFAFYVLGTPASELFDLADKICTAVTKLALVKTSDCELEEVIEAGTSQKTQEVRVYVELAIQSFAPEMTSLALTNAISYGAINASLASTGIKFDGVATSPPETPSSPAPSTPEESEDSGSSNLGLIIGSAVGGAVAVIVAAVTIFMVLRHKKAKSKTVSYPPSSQGSKSEQGLRNMYSQVNAISVTAGFKEAHATGYNGSPKCSLTPRHVALRQNSGNAADPSTV